MSGFCIFCAVVAGDAPARVVYDDDLVMAIMDINPFSRGHALVLPKEHHVDWLQAPAELMAHSTQVAQQVGQAAIEGLGADGVNLLSNAGAAAWQSVFHVHLHVLPRYREHPVSVPFRPLQLSDDELDAAHDALAARVSPA